MSYLGVLSTSLFARWPGQSSSHVRYGVTKISRLPAPGLSHILQDSQRLSIVLGEELLKDTVCLVGDVVILAVSWDSHNSYKTTSVFL